MKTIRIFLCLAGIFLAMLSSAAFAVDDNILRQGLAGEIVVQPANGKIYETPEAVASGGDILASNLSGEIEVPKPALPEKGQWMRLGDKSHNDTISEVAWPYCKKRDKATLEQILQVNNLTWESARSLRPGFEFFVPAELIKDEDRFPLEKVADLEAEVEMAYNKASGLGIELDNSKQAFEQLSVIHKRDVAKARNDLVNADGAIQQQKDRIESLNQTIAKTTEQVMELGQKLKQKNNWFWIAIAVGVLVSLILVALLINALLSNGKLSKEVKRLLEENNQLQSQMRAGRIEVRFDSDQLFGSYAFYCTAYYNENGKVIKYNINPLVWGGESVLDPKAGEAGLKSLLKKHLRGEEVPEVKRAFETGQLVQLETPRDPELEITDDAEVVKTV